MNRKMAHPRRGFSLPELLVVIGIIAALLALGLAVITKAQRAALSARIQGDLQAVAAGLEQYKNDFRSYPPVARTSGGRYVLCQALIAPGTAAEDGADGPGFRPAAGARIQKPYLNTDNFRVQRDGFGWVMLDPVDEPIEYYPRANERCPGPTGGMPPLVLPKGSGAGCYMYEEQERGRLNPKHLRAILGDTGGQNAAAGNNAIDLGERLRYSGPYILASSGHDRIFADLPDATPQAWLNLINKSGDVFNFDPR